MGVQSAYNPGHHMCAHWPKKLEGIQSPGTRVTNRYGFHVGTGNWTWVPGGAASVLTHWAIPSPPEFYVFLRMQIQVFSLMQQGLP